MQLLIRLYRNNLFLGNRINKGKYVSTSNCYLCCSHRDTRFLLYNQCQKVKYMVSLLIRIFLKAGLLECGIEIELFLLNNYQFNSIENISLTFQWSFVYNKKFNQSNIMEKLFFYILKYWGTTRPSFQLLQRAFGWAFGLSLGPSAQ